MTLDFITSLSLTSATPPHTICVIAKYWSSHIYSLEVDMYRLINCGKHVFSLTLLNLTHPFTNLKNFISVLCIWFISLLDSKHVSALYIIMVTARSLWNFICLLYFLLLSYSAYKHYKFGYKFYVVKHFVC